MYLQGAGVNRDYKLALEWYRKSAGQGNGEAQAYLGYMHEKGLGVDRDIQEALEFYKKSAAQGNALGRVRLGDLYLDGLGIDQNPRKALACYLQSAEQGEDPESAGLALLRLGAMHCQGRGVEKDLKMGFGFYSKSAKLGNAEAQLCLGAMYRDGVGVERDHKKALAWFQKSARKNKPPADSAMGDLYRDGLLVEKNIPEAMKWYKKAAERGDKHARTELLKLKQEESTQKQCKTNPAPTAKGDSQAMAEAANMQPSGMGVEKKEERDREREEKAVEDGAISVRGKPQPALQPVASQPQMKKGVPKKKSRRAVPQQAGRTKKILAARTHLYWFFAIGIIGLSLMIMLLGFRKEPEMTLLNLKPVALDSAALFRPDPQSLPGAMPEPFREALRKINAGKASRKPSEKVTVPIQGPSHAVIPSEPLVPRLRREYKSLDEGQISEMLTAKNLFDAERNPEGIFQHHYEAVHAAGLRMIVDRTTNLVWTRQQNLVKMNWNKSRQWIESLNHAEYGGMRNWRLPTVEEAASLLQKKAGDEKLFLAAIFGGDVKVIWTGDSFAGSESWGIDFQNGVIKSAKNKSRLMTLMVRSDSNSLSKKIPIQETPAADGQAEALDDRSGKQAE